MRATRTIRLSGCKKIPQSMVDIKVDETDDIRTFNAKLNLDQLNLLPTAEVYIDANVLNSYKRFSFGTIGDPQSPEDNSLNGLDVGGTVQFRVKVVDNSEHQGRLLAAANGIKAKEPGENESREALLHLRTYDLGAVPWRIEFLDDSMPGLILNKRIPGVIHRTETDPVYQALLLPAAIREVYRRAFSDPDFDPESQTWQGKWARFGALISGHEVPRVEEAVEVDQWIEAVVEKFSTEHGIVDKVLHELERQ